MYCVRALSTQKRNRDLPLRIKLTRHRSSLNPSFPSSCSQAPEILDASRYNASVDVYSFAVTMFACMCGDYAILQFRGASRYAVCSSPGGNDWRPMPTKVLENKHPLVWALIQECWRSEQTKVEGSLSSVLAADIAKRPTFAKIVEMLETMRPSTTETMSMQQSDWPSRFDVTSTEIEHVENLLHQIPFLGATPSYIVGSVALLRIVREKATSTPLLSLAYAQNMLNIRDKLGSDAKATEILEQGLTLHTFPGNSKVHAASWETNEFLATNKLGDVVVFERWGVIELAKFMEEVSVPEYEKFTAYRYEARAIAFDLLSQRSKRVVRFSQVIDTHGTSLAHRKLMPYIKVFAASDAGNAVPPMRHTTYIVRINPVASGIINLAKRLFASEHQKKSVFRLTGNPFAASSDFSTLFEPNMLPTAVGGTLSSGTDGHCCRGVNLPVLSDADAVWSFYESCLTPSLKDQVAKRNAKRPMLPSDTTDRVPTFVGMFEPNEIEAVRARHRDSPKRFACFLSHHKQACAAEARLVKQQLESMLDAKVFLGKCSYLHPLLRIRH